MAKLGETWLNGQIGQKDQNGENSQKSQYVRTCQKG